MVATCRNQLLQLVLSVAPGAVLMYAGLVPYVPIAYVSIAVEHNAGGALITALGLLFRSSRSVEVCKSTHFLGGRADS
jgi:hypothetical protein